MFINNQQHWTTEHAKLRYVERVLKVPLGYVELVAARFTNAEIVLATANNNLPDFHCVWKIDEQDPRGMRLVTIMENHSNLKPY